PLRQRGLRGVRPARRPRSGTRVELGRPRGRRRVGRRGRDRRRAARPVGPPPLILDRTTVRNYSRVVHPQEPWRPSAGNVTPPLYGRLPSPSATAGGRLAVTKGRRVERDKALEMALASIDKQFGKG